MNAAWAKEWVDSFSNVEKCVAMYADEAQFEDVVFAHKANGKDAIRKFFATGVDPAFGEHLFGFAAYTGNVDGGAVEWTWDAKNMKRLLGVPAQGKETSTRGVSILTFKNGKIATQHDYWNAAAPLRQLGTLK